jgi:Domain of unknown function (DUF4258)
MVSYVPHAKDRMRERSITEAEVEQTLASPLKVVPIKYGRSAAACLLAPGRGTLSGRDLRTLARKRL